jgi:glycosyltransferase involved in cell wall biosynthesis
MMELGTLPPVPVRYVPELGREVRPGEDLRALVEVVRIARAFRPDIVHTHLAKAGVVGRIAGRLARARAVVHTYHGTVFRGYFGPRRSALYLGIERALGRLSTRLIAITPGQRDELIALGLAPAERVELIPLGLDLERFVSAPDCESARRALGLADNAEVVAFVGRLVPIKNAPLFVRAFGEVARTRPRAVALVAGDGPEREAVTALIAKLGIADRVRLLGWRADTERIYAASDVVALSSLNEGSPVSLIEAMAAARAVVATNVGGVRDVVEDGTTGLLVPSSHAGALARAMASVLDDPVLRRDMGARGRASALERYSADRLVRDVRSLYERLLAHP